MIRDVEVRGIEDLKSYLGSIPGNVDRAAALAVSSATRYAYTLGRRRIQEEVNLPTGYLTGSEGGSPRFYISRKPTRTDPVGAVRGRVRATSLYRFVTGQSKRNGIRVAVSKRNGSRRIPRGFAIKLRNGNLGVAVRLPKGEDLRGKKNPGIMYGSRGGGNRKTNLFLLYGPSVQQVFNTVAPDIAPEVSSYLNSEFRRQIASSL